MHACYLCRKGLEQARSGWRRLSFPLLKLFLLNSTDLESDDVSVVFLLQMIMSSLECAESNGSVHKSRASKGVPDSGDDMCLPGALLHGERV